MKPEDLDTLEPEEGGRGDPRGRPASEPAASEESPGFLKRDLVLVLFMALFARLLLVGLVRPSLFWDSGSFLDLAKWILAKGFPPPVGLRPPGYPLFLLAAGGEGISLEGAVLVQRLLGVGSVVLVFLAARDLLRSRCLALAAAALFSFMPDLLFMEVTIYSETLTLFLLALSTWLLVRLWRKPSSLLGWGGLGLLLALAGLTRPIMILPALFFGAAAFFPSKKVSGEGSGDLRLHHRLSRLAAFLAPLVLLVGGMIAWNGARWGVYRIADGMGFSSLDYVGHPAIFKNLPPRLRWVTKVYESKEKEKEPWLPYVRWSLVYKGLMEEGRKAGLDTKDWDRASLRITMDAVRVRPWAYMRIWLDAFWRYWTGYKVLYGLWERYQDLGQMEKVQVCLHRVWAVKVLEEVFSLLQPLLSFLALLSFPLVLIGRKWEGGGRRLVLWFWLTVLVVSLVNTGIEPCLGQFRYRMPWTPLILLLSAVSLLSLGRILTRFTREGGPAGA